MVILNAILRRRLLQQCVLRSGHCDPKARRRPEPPIHLWVARVHKLLSGPRADLFPRTDVEIGFFARWFDQQPERVVNMTKKVVANKQLEFINGGWCMHGRPTPTLTLQHCAGSRLSTHPQQTKPHRTTQRWWTKQCVATCTSRNTLASRLFQPGRGRSLSVPSICGVARS